MALLCTLVLPIKPVEALSGVGSGGQCAPIARPVFRGFVENHGQWETDARFVASFDDMLVRAEPGAIVVQRLQAIEDHARLAVVKLVLDEAESVEPHGGARASGDSHYFYGNDPSSWRQHVPAYGDVLYQDVSRGIDVKLSRRDGHFEYDVILPESAEVGDFVVRCEGIDDLVLEPSGDLRMDTPAGPLIQHAPRAWQVDSIGRATPATCTFRKVDSRHFGFSVPDRVAGSSLVIDPGLTWATFLGGEAGDFATRVQSLASGNVLIVGRSISPSFPTTAGVYDTTLAGSVDCTVTCMAPDGDALVFSTYVGGSGGEVPEALAISSAGEVAFGGYTNSPDYPATPSAYDGTFNGGEFDAFVSALSPDGSELVLSTLLGGACNEFIHGVAFTANRRIVAAGNTCSPSFPATPSAFDTSFSGMADGVVCWFDPLQSGSAQLVCSSFLGSAGTDQILDLTMGAGDEPILVGSSTSADFPTTAGAYDETAGGNFITRFAADGSSLVASTHFKGGNPYLVALDGDTILIAGNPSPTLLPVSPNAFDSTDNGQVDGFVARLDSPLTQVLAATYLGGSRHDNPHGLAIDPSGNIAIVGYTESDDYPTTVGAYDTVKGGPLGSVTSMVSLLSSDLSQLLYSSFLGPAGLQSSWANDVVALGAADVVIVGEGALPGFPVTPGAFDETFNGGTLGTGDGYVARMLLEPLTWFSLGGEVLGSNGTPNLAGSGDLVGGQPVTLTLTSAKPVTPATLIVGVSLLNAPFKGGTLVPNPALMLFGLPTNAHGSLVLSATWPAGLPSGFSFYTQYWIPDAAAPAGLAGSNGLAGTTP